MTTIAAAEAKRAYDIERRPRYAERKRYLRRTRWREKEAARIARDREDRDKWGKLVLPQIRHRARKAGVEFSITAEDIPLPLVCPVLDIPLVIGTGKGLNRMDSPSVDRIDNAKGYVPGNVRVISTRANLLKKDATLDELRRLVAYVEGALP